MNAADATRKPFSPETFWRLAGVHFGLLAAAIVPLFFVDRQYWMAVIVLYGAAMGFLEHRSRAKIEEPSDALPKQVQSEVRAYRTDRRRGNVIQAAFFPMMLFALGMPQDDQPLRLISTAGFVLAIYIALSIWILYDKARE